MRKVTGGLVAFGLMICLATSGLAEIQNYNGRPMQRVGCSLSSPQACAGAGGRRIDNVGIWIGDGLHWRYTDVTTPREPRSASSITASRVIRSTILQPVAPQNQANKANVRHQGAFRADAFYNSWEGEYSKGATYGINPCIAFGDGLEATIRVPLYINEIDGWDKKTYSYGVDVTLVARLSDNLKIGAHGAYLREQQEDGGDEDATGYINGGPFAALVIPLAGASLSLGCLVEYGVPEDSEDGDETIVVVPGANLGIPLGPTLAVNVYGIYYYHTDSELSDYNYADAGGDLVFSLGETWNISVGARTVLGLDHLDSLEGYFGSEWLF